MKTLKQRATTRTILHQLLQLQLSEIRSTQNASDLVKVIKTSCVCCLKAGNCTLVEIITYAIMASVTLQLATTLRMKQQQLKGAENNGHRPPTDQFGRKEVADAAPKTLLLKMAANEVTNHFQHLRSIDWSMDGWMDGWMLGRRPISLLVARWSQSGHKVVTKWSQSGHQWSQSGRQWSQASSVIKALVNIYFKKINHAAPFSCRNSRCWLRSWTTWALRADHVTLVPYPSHLWKMRIVMTRCHPPRMAPCLPPSLLGHCK